MDGTTATRFYEGARLRDRLPIVLLAVAITASGAFILRLDSQLTFVADDWLFLVNRPGVSAGVFLDPYNGNLVVGLGIAFRLMRELFGMGSATPYYAVAISCFLASAVALFVYLRRRVGDWLALFAAVLILFLGAAFEDLLFAFQLGYFASVAAGLCALIALEREDPLGDRTACALLVVSLSFASIGLAFIAGVAVKVVLERGIWGRDLYIASIPILLYVIWWIGWGHNGENNVSAENVIHAPRYAYDAASAGVVSLLGLATGDGSEPTQPHLVWGHVLVVVGLVLLMVKVAREKRVPVGLAVALTAALAFWLLAGFNQDLSRAPASSRYQYPSAVFLLLIAGEMLRGLRLPKPAVIGAAAVTSVAVVGGVSLIQREHDERWVPYANLLRANLAAVEIAGQEANPDFSVSFPPSIHASATRYLAASDAHGSPAFSEAELSRRPEDERSAADLTNAEALGIAIAPAQRDSETLACQELQASELGETGITLLHGGFEIENQSGQTVDLSLGRFSRGLPVGFGPLAPGSPVSLYIPQDESTRPWRLGLTGSGPVQLCTIG